MGDVQSEVQAKVLDPEREINNAISYKTNRGSRNVPQWVMRGKVIHYNRLIERGKTAKIAAAEARTSGTTIHRYGKIVGIEVLDPRPGRSHSLSRKAKMPERKDLRRVGRRVHTYDEAFRREIAEKAVAMLRAGEIVNISEAGAKLGVHPTTVNSWAVKYGLIGRRRNKAPRAKSSHNGLSVSVDLVVSTFEELWPQKPQSKMRFENALLHAMLARKGV